LNKHRTSYNTSFILSTLLINQIFVSHSPTDAAPVSLETNPLYFYKNSLSIITMFKVLVQIRFHCLLNSLTCMMMYMTHHVVS